MTTVARRVGAIPVRSSVETWRAICALLAPQDSTGLTELSAATSVAALLIAEEYTSLAPVVVTGTGGTRVRVYTVHGAEAVDAQSHETSLTFWPCNNGTWAISFPCAEADLGELSSALKHMPRFTVRDLTEDARAEVAASADPRPGRQPTINLTELE
jgi:hypothetical protein